MRRPPRAPHKLPSADRVREDIAAYGAERAGVVVMEGRLLDEAENQMRSLRQKAVDVSHALTKAGIPHAVIGGMAVLAHALKADQGLDRTTRDLDVLINRSDLDMVSKVMKPLGYHYRIVLGIPAFLPPRRPEKSKSRFQDGVHIIWAGERVRESDPVPAPSLNDQPVVVAPDGYACLDVEHLLKMKLTSFRLKDQVHIQDLMAMGLISAGIKKSLPPALRSRLKKVEETTEKEKLG